MGKAESPCVRREVKGTRRGNEPSTTTITSRILDRVYLCRLHGTRGRAGCIAVIALSPPRTRPRSSREIKSRLCVSNRLVDAGSHHVSNMSGGIFVRALERFESGMRDFADYEIFLRDSDVLRSPLYPRDRTSRSVTRAKHVSRDTRVAEMS